MSRKILISEKQFEMCKDYLIKKDDNWYYPNLDLYVLVVITKDVLNADMCRF